MSIHYRYTCNIVSNVENIFLNNLYVAKQASQLFLNSGLNVNIKNREYVLYRRQAAALIMQSTKIATTTKTSTIYAFIKNSQFQEILRLVLC